MGALERHFTFRQNNIFPIVQRNDSCDEYESLKHVNSCKGCSLFNMSKTKSLNCN